MNRQLRDVVESLPPGAFAFVMATGIVSAAFRVRGWEAASVALLVVAIVGLVLLSVALLARLVRHPRRVLADAHDPARAFGFFTLVAAINVVGVRLYTPENPLPTIVLAAVSLPIWLLLSYGVPGALMLRPRDKPAASEINGSWFLWVVGTQSLAIAAAAIEPNFGGEAIAISAVGLWSIGVVLYLILATLVTLRLLTVRSEPASLGPSYWIYMGATAITVFAGSRILALPHDLPVMVATAAVVSGLTFVLWAFGVWWVPLLLIFGFWRHVTHRMRVRYESELWSIVFPLGMYAVASMHFGEVAKLPLVVGLGEAGTWIAGAAWVLVAAAGVAALVARMRRMA